MNGSMMRDKNYLMKCNLCAMHRIGSVKMCRIVVCILDVKQVPNIKHTQRNLQSERLYAVTAELTTNHETNRCKIMQLFKCEIKYFVQGL